MPVASLNEVRNFLSRVGIDDTAKFWRAAGCVAKHAAVVGNHADLNSPYARMTRNDLFSKVCLELVQLSFVQHTVKQRAHIVRLAMILRNDVIYLFQESAGILGSASVLAGGSQASSLRIQRQLRHKLSNLPQALLIILNPIMSHSRDFIMSARASESFIVNRLPSRPFNQVRSAQSHERSVLHHNNDT